MKKLLPAAALLFSVIYLLSCNKGDDNPYGRWRCTCFINKYYFVDTNKFLMRDTAVLFAENMDKESATAFCSSTQSGYSDTLGSAATCKLK